MNPAKLILLLMLFCLSGIQAQSPQNAPYLPGTSPQKDSVLKLSISLTGDLMCHKPQTNNAQTGANTYDFRPSFQYVKPYLSAADICIGNLETTLAGTRLPYAGYPAFNSPDEYASALKEAGFDFLVTANNHSMDTGEEGLLRTIEILNNNKLGYCGTYTSQADRDSMRIIGINGFRLGILNYTYGTNGAYPASHHGYMLNVIDSTLISNDIATLKKKQADIILVFYHFGNENIAEPTEAQKKAVKYAWQAGAQLIIGAHPHVIGPVTWLPPSAAGSDSTFVAYSLGNFISNQYWRYTDAGVILTLQLEKNISQQRCRLSKVSYLPTWVYRGDSAAMKQHLVLPAEIFQYPDKALPFLSPTHLKKMEEANTDTQKILSKYTQGIHRTPLIQN